MREFFKGWQRKSGVATLLLACVACCFMIRSTDTSDYLEIQYGPSWNYCSLTRNGFYWARIELISGDKWSEELKFEYGSLPPHQEWSAKNNVVLGQIAHDWQVVGFRSIDGPWRDVDRWSAWIIPYWSIIGFLTLLSAFLLLIIPRRTTRLTNTNGPTAAGT